MSPEEITCGLRGILERALSDPTQSTPPEEPAETFYTQLVMADVQRRMARQRHIDDGEASFDLPEYYLEPLYEMFLALGEEVDNLDLAVRTAWDREQERLYGDPETDPSAKHHQMRHVGELDEARSNAEAVGLLLQQVIGHYARLVQITSTWTEVKNHSEPVRSWGTRERREKEVHAQMTVKVGDRVYPWRLGGGPALSFVEKPGGTVPG